jgi:MFS family permease
VGVIVASQFLHGFCYACFFAVGYIYVDRIAPDDVRHSAQTVFGIVILGVGPVVAAPLLSYLSTIFATPDGGLDYSALWYTMAMIGFLTTLGFAALFRDESRQSP